MFKIYSQIKLKNLEMYNKLKILTQSVEYTIDASEKRNDYLVEFSNPKIVLKQSSNRVLFISDKAAVILDEFGQAVTVWGTKEFNSTLLLILNTFN